MSLCCMILTKLNLGFTEFELYILIFSRVLFLILQLPNVYTMILPPPALLTL